MDLNLEDGHGEKWGSRHKEGHAVPTSLLRPPPGPGEAEIWPWVLPRSCSESQLCSKARTLTEAGSLPLLSPEEVRAAAHVFPDPLSPSCPALRRVPTAELRQSVQYIPWPTKLCQCSYYGKCTDTVSYPDLPQLRSWVGSSSPPQSSLQGTTQAWPL